ncbi:hypothetical protein BFV67_22915 (plasmid) [Enterobacter roggenkampii]|nr:hypothetical protein BFV67_22915 [Enterobacter roggenkampii]
MMDSPKKNIRSRNRKAPTTEELKFRFQTRSLKLERDFQDLIEVEECGPSRGEKSRTDAEPRQQSDAGQQPATGGEGGHGQGAGGQRR